MPAHRLACRRVGASLCFALGLGCLVQAAHAQVDTARFRPLAPGARRTAAPDTAVRIQNIHVAMPLRTARLARSLRAHLIRRWGGRYLHDSVPYRQQVPADALTWLAAQGYPEAQAALERRDAELQVQVQTGPLYLLDSLGIRGAAPADLTDAGLDAADRRRPVAFRWPWVDARLARLLRLADARGYPFARLSPPQVQYRAQGDTVLVALTYDWTLGPAAVVDSIVPLGKIRERPSFLHGLLGIRPGDVYNGERLAQVPVVLNNTPYYRDVQAPQVVFRPPASSGNLLPDSVPLPYRATVRIPMQPRKSNRFDAIVGILPPRGQNLDWQFTALVDILLVSPLRAGEILNFKYEQYPNQSSRLDLRVLAPSILRTPLRVELRFDLQRQDSTFLTRNFEPTAYWALTPQLALKAYYRSRLSTVVTGAQFRDRVWPPPPVLDGQSTLAGFGFRYDGRDNRANPTRGWFADVDYGIGTKRLRRSAQLPALDYERLRAEQPRRELRLSVQRYQRVGRRQVLALGARSHWVDLDEAFENDLVFVGGAQLLRGFNENQFLVSSYAYGTVEYRLLLDEQSYIGPFVDYGILRQQTFALDKTLHPLGAGLTLTLDTAAGLISVTYAVGQTEEQPFQPARGRIHIGFVSQF